MNNKLLLLIMIYSCNFKKKKYVHNVTGSKFKKKLMSPLWQPTEKDKLPISNLSKFKLPEGIGGPKAGKQIQNFPVTLIAHAQCPNKM